MTTAPNNQDNIQSAQHDGRLRQAQLKMLTILEVVDSICQKHHLDYWLEGGTLLGAIRHQGFIPWDDDLDISMPRESYEAFLRLAPDEMPKSMWLQTPKTDPGYFDLSVPLKIRDLDSRFISIHEQGNEPYQQGIFIDVFVYDRMPTDKMKRRLRKLKAKKTLRLLYWKYASIPCGHYAHLYKNLSRLFPKQTLENMLKKIIRNSNQADSPYLGYGYDCVNSNCVDYEDIYPLQRTVFEGRSFKIARRPEAILTQLFGDFMQLPPENERIMKHCRELIPSLSQIELISEDR
ncbi:LicD family protein [Legionella israelensis]|uniref:LicD family protein n=1 Tax=Legionella israelensis TaxID=454 RepID=UPI00117E08DD|nr:LicD family protein [Legionella israelensis]QDP73408.1 LicD family protein [Legionella israelensis]